jgi:hypothetical protein
VRRIAATFFVLVAAVATVTVSAQAANAEVYNTCRPSFWTGKCSSGYTPANHTLNRVWIGINNGNTIEKWEVWDRDTGARVGQGSVAGNSDFRTGIYGLYGNHYQLVITQGAWGDYDFICDC